MRSQGEGRKVNTGLRGLVPRSGLPLAAERPLYSELVNTRHGHATTHTPTWRRRHPSEPLRPVSLPPTPAGFPPPPGPLSCLFASRWLYDGREARLPLLAFFGRGPAAVSSSLPDPVDSASGDPAPDSLGEDAFIYSFLPRRPVLGLQNGVCALGPPFP